MKKFFKIGAAIFLLLTVATFTSCVNMLYDIDFSGYIYKLEKIESIQVGGPIPDEILHSTLSFSKDGMTATLIIGDSKDTGTYSIDMEKRTVTIDFGETTNTYSYSGNGAKLKTKYAKYPTKDDDQNGPYTFTYTLM